MIVKSNLFEFISRAVLPYTVISVTGAGGKTALLNFLSREFGKIGKTVMLSTTTHLSANVEYEVDEIIKGPLSYHSTKRVLYVHDSEEEGKYKSPGERFIVGLGSHFDKLIIEADGSKMLPLKYHKSTDPAIVQANQFTFCVVGLSSLSKPLQEVMCGYNDYVTEFSGRKNCKVDVMDLHNLLISKNGIYKGTNPLRRMVILNQFDEVSDSHLRSTITNFAIQRNLILASIKDNILYKWQ